MKSPNRLLALASLLLAFSASAIAADPVGRVLLAAGEVFAVRDGKQVPLQFNSMVELRDVLRTGAASSLQVRFVDESLISVRENSDFAIEDYQFGAKEQEQRSFFQLVKGGFRAVSGLIGRRNHADYRVRAATATIGIRGTDYAVRDCRGDCGAGVKDGLYGTVLGQSTGTNQITVTNNAGESTFGINQHFYVPDANSRPQPLLQPPSFVSLRPQGKAQAVQQSAGTGAAASGSGTEEAAPSSGVQAESRPAATPELAVTEPLIVTQPYQVTETLTTTGTLAALPPANGFVVVWPGSADFFGQVLFDDNYATATFNSQNQLLSYSFSDMSSGSLGAGSITDAGSITLSNGQVFSWGRWTGGDVTSFTSAETLATLSGVPLLFGTASGLTDGTVVGTIGGVADYTYAGGPSPVDFGGNVGSITSTTLNIDFTNLTMSLSLGMSFPTVVASGVDTGSASFNLTGTAQSYYYYNYQNGDFFGYLSGTCSGGGCATSSPSGYYTGGVTGPNGYGAAVVGGLVYGTQAGDVAFLNAYLLSSYTPGAPPVGPLTGQVAWADAAYAPSGKTSSLDSNFTTYNASNQPTSFSDCASGTCTVSGNLGTGTIVEVGSTTLADGGIMAWGRWSGGQITDLVSGTSYTPVTGVPFVIGNANTLVPNSGSFVYSFAGAPSPVDTRGNVGTFTGGAFNVSFGATQTISVASPLTMSVGGVDYSLNGGGSSVSGPALVQNMTLFGTCSNCSTAGATSAATAMFVGPQAGGLAVAGNITSPNPTVSFAAGFKR